MGPRAALGAAPIEPPGSTLEHRAASGVPINVDVDDARTRQRQGTRQLLVSRGVFFASAYVVSAILTRRLGPLDYGVYGVVISQLLWLEMVVHAGVPAATSKLIADGKHRSEDVERSARAILLAAAGLLFAACWVAAPALADLMQIENGAWLFRLAIVDLPFAAAYASYEGILYGHRRFSVLAKAQIAYGLTRVTAIAALATVGLTIERVLVAMALSTLTVTALIAIRYPPRGLRGARATMRELARTAAPLAVCLVSGQVLLNLDLWSLKGLWTGAGEIVGHYVASSNLARTLAVVPTVQAGVLFTSVAWALASDDVRRAAGHIQEASRFALVIAAGTCVILGPNGGEVLGLLFSAPYADGQRFLVIQLVGFGMFAVLDVFANSLMAAGRHWLVATVLTAAIPLVWVSNYVLITRVGPVGAAVSMLTGIVVATVVTGALAARRFGPLIRGWTVARVAVASVIAAAAGAAVEAEGALVLLKLAGLGALYMGTLYVLGEITVADVRGTQPSHHAP